MNSDKSRREEEGDWSTTSDIDKKNKRILLVDDEQDVTYTVKMVLENNGFLVDSYNDPSFGTV